MMLDAIDVNFFPVSPAMFFRDDRSCVACQENTKGVNSGLQKMTDHMQPQWFYLEWDSVDQIWSIKIHAEIVRRTNE